MNIREFMSVGPDEKPLDRIVTDGGFCSIFRTIACIGDSLSSGEMESTREDGTGPLTPTFITVSGSPMP